MSISGSNIIGSKKSVKGKDIFHAYNPKTQKALSGDFVSATEEEVNLAMEISATAFESYKLSTSKVRARFLRTIASNIELLGEELVNRVMAESGLPEARILGERGRTVNQLRMFADFVEEGSWVEASIDTAMPDRTPVPKPDIRRMLLPIGPVVVFGASNFPLAFSTAGGDTASALAAGNPVVVKGHESHPGTNELVAQAIKNAVQECDLPEGVFSSLNGNGPAVGQMLVKHPLTKAVGFTGSYRAGKALFDAAAQRKEPIPVFAEMGSTNPIILLPQIIEEKSSEIAATVAGSVSLGTGQFCTKPGLLIGIKSAALENFSKNLAETLTKTSHGSMLNKGIYNNFENSKKSLLENNGVLLKGEYSGPSTQELEGRPAVAVVSAQKFIGNPNLHEEIFGPFTLLVVCENMAELENVISSLQGQLTASLFGTEAELLSNRKIAIKLREKAGRILFNNVPTGVEVCHSMNHGGPFPASTDNRFTSVGTSAIKRFVRPIAFQNWPDELLLPELQNANPQNIWRLINGSQTREKVK